MVKKNTVAAKPKPKPMPEPFPRKSVHVRGKATDSEEEKARQYAAVVTSPELAAYRVINGAEHNSGIGDDIDVPSLIADLRAQGAAVNSGEMRQAEAMLINQATALQSLFARLAERGMASTGLPQFEVNMRLALRAQSQCRATLETLAAIKNPPVIFAKQANIANGHQQINNGAAIPAHAEENKPEQTKVIEAQHGNYLVTRATGEASGGNQTLEAVGAIDRAVVGRG